MSQRPNFVVGSHRSTQDTYVIECFECRNIIGRVYHRQGAVNREAKATNDHQLLARVTLDPDVVAGKPIIKGTRLTVEYVLGLLAQPRRDPERSAVRQQKERLHAAGRGTWIGALFS